MRRSGKPTSISVWESGSTALASSMLSGGEMVGFFVADVVSARDTANPIFSDFESIRIGQWAVRAERFPGTRISELLWVPYVSYDEVGKPGADFYPYPLRRVPP